MIVFWAVIIPAKPAAVPKTPTFSHLAISGSLLLGKTHLRQKWSAVEFSNNSLLILTSTAKSLDSLEKNSIDTIIKNSQEKISKGEISDKERYLLSYKIDTLREINK